MLLVPHDHILHADDPLTGPVVGGGDGTLLLLRSDLVNVLATPLHRHQLPLRLREGAHQA